MQFDGEGRLHVFAYNIKDERHMDHIVSEDKGKTWGAAHTNYLAHGIRNPQINIIDGIWVCHGRAEQESGFVLYTSPDGENWDEGEFIGTVKGYCYYSNNIVLKDKDITNRLLIQYSQNYRDACVNIFHRWLKIKK